MDAQSSGSINQTQNPQANSPTIFAQSQGVQAGMGGSFDINTSSTANSINISTLPVTASSSVVPPAAPKKNYAPLMIASGIFVVVIIVSVIFVRAAKKTVY
jgi:hypothetical protein